MRSLARISVLLPVLLLALTACGERSQEGSEQMEMGAAPDRARLLQALEVAKTEFMEAVRAGDAAAAAAFYTDDATLLPPEAGDLAKGGLTLNLNTVSVDGAGDFAYEIGTWSMPAPEGESGSVEEGKYLVVWKHLADGSWKVHADIWNNSTPSM
jgi:ketosteroid isomerase-like protein